MNYPLWVLPANSGGDGRDPRAGRPIALRAIGVAHPTDAATQWLPIATVCHALGGGCRRVGWMTPMLARAPRKAIA